MYKIIPDFENYKINEHGNIIPKVKTFVSTSGYLYARLNGSRVSVHRLVAKLFVPNPDNKPCVNHIDNNRLNNDYENLEWVTHKENTAWAKKQGRLKTNHEQNFAKIQVRNCKITSKQIDQYDKDWNFIRTWPSMAEVQRQTGMYATNICQACKCNGKVYGYFWKYHNKTSND